MQSCPECERKEGEGIRKSDLQVGFENRVGLLYVCSFDDTSSRQGLRFGASPRMVMATDGAAIGRE